MAKRSKQRASGRRVFLTGLVIILPVVVSFWVVKFILGIIHNAITPYVLKAIDLAGFDWILDREWVSWTAPFVSLCLLVIIIMALGFFGGNVIGRQILGALDTLLTSIPVVRPIYSATRQFVDTFSTNSRAFRKVVMVEYPRHGLWTLALLTNDAQGEVLEKSGGNPMVSVFVPTTPNPTSGWLLFVPVEDVIELEMSIDEAFKLIISGGVLIPGMSAGPRQLPIDEVTEPGREAFP